MSVELSGSDDGSDGDVDRRGSGQPKSAQEKSLLLDSGSKPMKQLKQKRMGKKSGHLSSTETMPSENSDCSGNESSGEEIVPETESGNFVKVDCHGNVENY